MHSRVLAVFLFIGAIGIQGCSSSRNAVDPAEQDPGYNMNEVSSGEQEYRIRPGDEIEILVWEQPSFNTLTTVSRMGSIAVPLIGEVEVMGLTQDEFERELIRRMGEYVRGEVNLTVSIRNTENLLVSIFGMVTRPDNYPVVDEISIFRILSTAGGPTELANMKEVKLYKERGSGNYITVDLTQYLEVGNLDAAEIMVKPGDVIYVPPKNNLVRDMSEFLRDVVILFGIFRVFN